ncbi:MAG: hypothetical protein AB7G44_07090 [Bacteroidia bacterium]
MSTKTYIGATEVLSQNGSVLDCKGFVPTYKVLDDYSHLILPGGSSVVFDGDLSFPQIVKMISRVEKQFRHRVAPLAKHLQGDSNIQNVFNVWHWMKTNLAYKFDSPGKEEIRTPSRSYADRFTGVDCEDMAIFGVSLLQQMNDGPEFEIVAFNNKEHYGHIYTVCNGVVCDAVLNAFNEHPKYITKDMRVQVLDGVEERPMIYGLGAVAPADNTTLALMDKQSEILKAAENRNLQASEKRELRKIRFCIMLNELPERDIVLDIMPHVHDITEDGGYHFKADAPLGAIEEYLEGLEEDGYFDYDDEDEDGLGKKSKAERKKERQAKRKKRKEKFKKSKFGKFLKKGARVFNRFLNPATIAARNGFLLAMKLNLFKIAGKLKWGYYTEQEAIAKGATKAKWQKAVTLVKRVEKLIEKLGGKAKNLKNAVLKGRATKKERKAAKKQLKGIYGIDVDAILSGAGLGDGGITAGAAITAAMAVITSVVAMIKKGGMKKEGEFPDEGVEGQAADASAADLSTVESATEKEVEELEGKEQSAAEDAGFKTDAEATTAAKALKPNKGSSIEKKGSGDEETEEGEKKGSNMVLYGLLGLGLLGAFIAFR